MLEQGKYISAVYMIQRFWNPHLGRQDLFFLHIQIYHNWWYDDMTKNKQHIS